MKKKTKKALVTMLSAAMISTTVIPSAVPYASADTPQLIKKFDFGTKTSPVMEGYIGVHDSLLYTADLGYGLEASVVSRLRSGGDDATNDFILGTAYVFKVDLPNGEYDVTVYSGDLLTGTSTTKTTIALEGETKGTVSSRQAITQATYRAVVTDGQLTVNVSGTGAGGYLNALVIEQVVQKAPATPTGLAVTSIQAGAATSSVALQWDSVAEAASYNVYRKEAGAESFTKLGSVTNAAAYTDTTVAVGNTYEYQVTAVGASSLESAPSGSVSAEVKLPEIAPVAPINLAATSVTDAGIQLSWSAAEYATSYTIYRSDAAEGTYTEIGTNTSPTYTDSSADTSKVWHYKVKAANAHGTSDYSAAAASSIYTPPAELPEGAIKLDFGSGAVADGYIGVAASTAYTPSLHYGFADPSKVTAEDRGTGDAIKSDFVSPQDTSFHIDLPNGDYKVELVAGDAADASEIAIKAETIQKVQTTSKVAGEYLEMEFKIALVDGQLNLDFAGAAPKLNALIITKLDERTAGQEPNVYIAGDSTVQTYDPYWEPEAGWGQMLPRFFNDDVTFTNKAIGGRSSKSFIVEGRLDEILLAIKPGDYFLIQFGHNDATISVPERYASVPDYKNYLKTYVNGARQRGATPILVTPMGRRDFNETTGKFNVSFPEYVAGMKEVAEELNVPLVDLSTLSVAYYDSIGPAASLSVFLHVEPGIYGAFPNGSADNTHFQEYGAIQLARLLSGGIQELDLPLADYVQDIEPPAEVPAKPTGVIAGSISNAGAVLKWNEVEQTDIYKIYRKLASDTEYTMVGTATVPTITLGGMSEGQTYNVYVTAVNGKGESAASEPVTITTKAAAYRYDMGAATSPVMAGYTPVTLDTLYTRELGYGLTMNAGMITRDRGTSAAENNDLIRDWLGYFNNTWEFKVDLPNGAYAVKAYVGDLLGSARTTIAIEGKDFGTVSAAKNSVAEKVISEVQVRDGQMNMVFGGSTGIINGIEITPILQSPTDVRLDNLQLDQDPPLVTLSWKGPADAESYNVYRTSEVSSTPELLGMVNTTAFTDITADLGMSYTYTVTSLDSAGFETVPSNPLQVSTIDPEQQRPAVPTGLAQTAIHKNDVSFSWNKIDNAITYAVFRASKADGTYSLIGKTRDTSFTDTTVLTTVPYYYKVAAINAGGVSELSQALATEAVTQLYRQMEYLDRAPVAVKREDGVYIGWKLLGTDSEAIAFNVYRDGVKLNDAPITDSTNFLDEAGTATSKYQIISVLSGAEQAATKQFAAWEQNYLSIPLQKPADDYTKDGQPYSYVAGDASVGDLDGDGTYEIVQMWSPTNQKDNSQAGITGIVYLDAYRMDGTRLWRINLGPNIRAGAHYSPFMVYDLDGDGKAEVTLKTADGTVDGQGTVIGDATADYRNSTGYVLLGNEYLTVFNGLTGAAIDTVNYDPPRGDVSSWGDAYGNRVDRFLASVAYLDGEHPSLVFSRGYYTRTVIAAYDLKDGKLTKRWKFDSNDEAYGSAYTAQGNHNMSVGDYDGDGKDEITFGAMGIDDDGKPLYNTGLGHGDALHVGDLDPTRPGKEVFDVHEHTDSPYGMDFRDAATGEILWGVHTGIDTGRGMSADIDPNHIGEEVWSATITNEQHIPITGLYNARGELLSTTVPSSTNFGIWWDGDLLRELLDGTRIDKWDYVNTTTNTVFKPEGVASNNSTKANPNLQADLFGDWREEVIWRTTDSTELRIYTTTDLTDYRIHTLMHDPDYRLAVAWQNSGYNQPPHPSFYLGAGMTAPPAPRITVVGGPTGTEDTTAPVLTGLNDRQLRESDTLKIEVSASDAESGIESLSITLDGTPVEVGQEIPLSGLKGTHTLTATAVNKSGLTTTGSATIQVYGAGELYASISGSPANVLGGSEFATDYTLHNIADGIYAQDITVSYDADAIEFVGAASLVEGFQLLTVDSDTPGRIRIIAASQGESSAIDEDTTLIKLNWKAKVLAEPVSTAISFANTASTGTGAESQVAAASAGIQIQPGADKTVLASLLASAQEQFDKAKIGTKPGQYSQQAKDAFGAAIAQAAAIAEDDFATSVQVAQAVERLTAAMNAFAASVVVAQPGDSNQDGAYTIGDLGIVAAAYGKTNEDPQWIAVYQHYDLDHDNVIDLDDLVIVAQGILQTP
ncbi:fibronectin type 3 domain-containing protein [Paenibacillus phyllosphaerae]|uniref:Fibronectin type 3 domain-containing protein n=1 Tax=Paenibacillus phyllosphaerae TaxID=274593 RepID=A0A7W5FPB0_9BACL|nr:SGNH/GDSL hydrolase family protein [Paenibacillus phyllosphaerae]MBB3112165.1 fibronectin type 3 domain-containing protein [Paenibacillus phyllosphaerae]